MPIIALTHFTTQTAMSDIYAANWRVVPGELLDFSKFVNIRILHLSAFSGDSDSLVPYTVPSFANIFPNLTQLYVKNWDLREKCFIGCLTDVPNSVIECIMENTYITDLSPLLSSAKNLLYFTVRDNMTPISMSHPLPETLLKFSLYRTTVTDVLIFPKNIRTICGSQSTFPGFQGIDRLADPSNVIISIYDCISPYNNMVLGIEGTSKNI
jgi:hypothetical protein